MDLQQRRLWNENHKKLTSIITNSKEHHNTLDLFFKQHALLFSSRMAPSEITTLEDELFHDITEETLRKYPVASPDTRNSIVWHVWHITRIEDMTMNVLVDGGDQIFHEGGWPKQLKVDFPHSGNEMSEDEIEHLSTNIDIPALQAYRLEVGRKTREIVSRVSPGQFKQKVEPTQIQRLEKQDAVKKEAAWLLEYWGGKTLAGLILMPATRHNFLHLNKSIRIKHRIQKNVPSGESDL